MNFADQLKRLIGRKPAVDADRQSAKQPTPWGFRRGESENPYLAARRLRMKSDSPPTRLLVNQLREFPVADHDDGPDALEMAVRLLEHLLARPPDDGLGDRLPVG